MPPTIAPPITPAKKPTPPKKPAKILPATAPANAPPAIPVKTLQPSSFCSGSGVVISAKTSLQTLAFEHTLA